MVLSASPFSLVADSAFFVSVHPHPPGYLRACKSLYSPAAFSCVLALYFFFPPVPSLSCFQFGRQLIHPGLLYVVKSNLLRFYDVDLLRLFYDVSQQVSSFVRSTAVGSTTFAETCSFSSFNSHNLRRHRSPSRRPDRGCVSYFFVSCLMISIDRPVCPFFAWPVPSCCCCCCCCWRRQLYRCYTCSRHIIT